MATCKGEAAEAHATPSDAIAALRRGDVVAIQAGISVSAAASFPVNLQNEVVADG